MKKVTFKSIIKSGGTLWSPKKIEEFVIVEYTEADDAAIRLRAMALNWEIIKIEIGV